MSSNNTTYFPPPDPLIQEFAKQVGEALAAHRSDSRFTHPEVIDGFANYFRLVSHLEANRLSQTDSE